MEQEWARESEASIEKIDSCLENRALTEKEIAKEANLFMEYEGCLKNEEEPGDRAKGFIAPEGEQKHQMFSLDC